MACWPPSYRTSRTLTFSRVVVSGRIEEGANRGCSKDDGLEGTREEARGRAEREYGATTRVEVDKRAAREPDARGREREMGRKDTILKELAVGLLIIGRGGW